MRFVVTGEWSRNRLLRLIIVCFLVYAAALWLTNGLLYFAKMDLTYRSVIAYYRGSEAEFRPPRTYQGLLEVAHFHVFAMGIFVLTLTHLMLFVPLAPWLKAGLIIVAFAAALADESAGWLTRFVHPAFAVMKITAFLALEAALAVLIVAVLIAILRGQRNAYAEDPGWR